MDDYYNNGHDSKSKLSPERVDAAVDSLMVLCPEIECDNFRCLIKSQIMNGQKAEKRQRRWEPGYHIECNDFCGVSLQRLLFFYVMCSYNLTYIIVRYVD